MRIKKDLHSQNFWIYYTYPPGMGNIYLSIYNAYKRQKKETTHSVQKSKKPTRQNHNHGRKRWILYRYSTTEPSSNWFIKKYKSTAFGLTFELLFCRRRESQWQKKNEYNDWRNTNNCENSSKQIMEKIYFTSPKCMKKILSITMLIVYIFSINTLVHASTMGFFSHTTNETWHCHAHQQASTSKTQNIDCCELAFSSEYSDTQIQLEYTVYTTHITPTYDYLIKSYLVPNTYKEYIAWSPWRNTNIKYNKFSDLFGSIVNLS